jgi:hypothetical protein
MSEVRKFICPHCLQTTECERPPSDCKCGAERVMWHLSPPWYVRNGQLSFGLPN